MNLISYAIDFVSFLVQNLKKKEINKIKMIILFGSVARDEATKESDIDLFVDTKEKIEKEIKKIKDKFYGSAKFKNYWKMLGIENDINIIVGQLEKWKLKDTMVGNSIILYQKYAPKLEEGKNKIILIWGNVKPNSKRVLLSKQIFGYNYYGKFYKGLLQKYDGKKLGSGVIMIPAEHMNLFIKTFRKLRSNVEILRVFEYV